MRQNDLGGVRVALLALALTACQQSGDRSNLQGSASGEINSTSSSPDAGNASGSSAAPAAATIPAQYHGRWGLVAADCTSTRGDAKGLLTIDGARLVFYEARGTVGQILGTTATSFDARYDFTGEGQTWKRTERLSVVNGKLQRRTDAEPGQEPPVNLTYTRCAA